MMAQARRLMCRAQSHNTCNKPPSKNSSHEHMLSRAVMCDHISSRITWDSASATCLKNACSCDVQRRQTKALALSWLRRVLYSYLYISLSTLYCNCYLPRFSGLFSAACASQCHDQQLQPVQIFLQVLWQVWDALQLETPQSEGGPQNNP